MDPISQPKLRYEPTAEEAARITDAAIAFIRAYSGGARSNNMSFSAIAVPAAIGAVLTAGSFSKKFSKTTRIASGIGATLSGIIAAGTGFLKYKNSRDLDEVARYLNKVEHDPSLKSELINHFIQHLPTQSHVDGQPLGYNDIVIGNMVLNYGRDHGHLQPTNMTESLSLSLAGYNDPEHVRLRMLVNGSRTGIC